MSEQPPTSANDESASTDGNTIDIRFSKAGGTWTANVLAFRDARTQSWSHWRLVRTGLLAAAEFAVQFAFGFLLGSTDVAAVYATPAGAWRTAVWVATILGSAVAVLVMNRAVSIARGRRPWPRRCHPSTDSQIHNLSSRALNWRFRRG